MVDVCIRRRLFEDIAAFRFAFFRRTDHLLAFMHVAAEYAPLVIAHAENGIVFAEIQHQVGISRILRRIFTHCGEFVRIGVNQALARGRGEEFLHLPGLEFGTIFIINRVGFIRRQIDRILDQPACCAVLAVVGVRRLMVGEHDLRAGRTDDLREIITQRIDAVNTVRIGFRIA